ncbi:Hypothetical protein CINCED_3A006724 [Cinara cedri]|uniref:Uncharacterized protein n=1 Tax=Cinara cedri TaxID=506608 RepID=A0A5E4N7Y1_9HEMI|nr:Hypothetical protein CINCED_3A006724 [Cinara cedri]
MRSFLFKIVCCILIINVTFCRSCFKSACRASCYATEGIDFGYCEDDFCKCSPPTIFVFDGIGRDLNDNQIKRSLSNNNLIQNTISTSNYIHRPKAPKLNELHEKNRIWRKILIKITKEYSFIKEHDLKNLKASLFKNITILKYFYNLLLRKPLVDVLKEMKNKRPASMSNDCEDLLKRLRRPRVVNNNPENLNTKHLSSRKDESDTDDEVPNHKIVLEVSEESVDDDDGNSGEEKDVPKKPEQNHPQVVKDGNEPTGSYSEYEYVDDDDDERVKDK